MRAVAFAPFLTADGNGGRQQLRTVHCVGVCGEIHAPGLAAGLPFMLKVHGWTCGGILGLVN